MTVFSNILSSFRTFVSHDLLTHIPTSLVDSGGGNTFQTVLGRLKLQGEEFLSRFPVAELGTASLYIPTFISSFLLIVLFTMSWSSRFGSWGGRFSPFGRNGAPPGQSEVTDKDYSYITSSDLAKAESYQAASSLDISKLPPRDTDVVTFKHKRESYHVHFPAYSIDKDELRVGEIRAQAARKLNVSDPLRIKLLYRGRNLRDDDSTAREAGMQSNGAPEILCVVGEVPARTGDGASDDEADDVGIDGRDDGEDSPDDGSSKDPSGPAKRKRRSNHKKKKKPKDWSRLDPGSAHGGESGNDTSTSTISTNLPVPATPMAKLDALATIFRTTFLPQCTVFMADPPADKTKRESEHKRLTETILAQVLLKLDAVETEGDEEARRRRKEVVRECQDMLNRLDAVLKR